MYCPVCENEYEPGVDQCPNCGSQLVANLSGGSTKTSSQRQPHREQSQDPEETSPETAFESDQVPIEAIRPAEVSELVQIYSANGLEADLIRSVLEGSRIAVLMKRSGMEGVYGPVHDTHLLVREDDEERAREIIRAAHAGEFQIEDED